MFSKTFLFILIIGFLLRIFLFFNFLDAPGFFLDDDSEGYLQLAENLRQGRGFSWEETEPFTPNSFRTPGYPLFLLFHRLVFSSYQAALVSQMILVIGVAFFLFLLARELGQPKIGQWAAAIFLFMPFSVMVSLRYLTQPLFIFGLMLAVWLWLKFLKTGRSKYFWPVIFLLPVLALIRPIAVFIYIPFIISLFYSRWFLNKKRFFSNSFVLVFIFFLVLSPWLIRNLRLFGELSLSSIGPYQLYFYDTPAVYASNHSLSFGEARQFLENDIKQYLTVDSFEDYMKFSSGAVLSERSWFYLKENWFKLAITRAVLFFKFFIRDGIRYWLEWFDYKVSFGLILLERGIWLALFAGWVVSLIEAVRTRSILIFGHLLILYFALLTGAVASAGLRFVVDPLIIFFGLSGLKKCLQYIFSAFPVFTTIRLRL